MVVAIEPKGKGVSRMYGRVIETASRKNLRQFMAEHIDAGADVRTDGWSGYQGLEAEFPRLVREKKGKTSPSCPAASCCSRPGSGACTILFVSCSPTSTSKRTVSTAQG